MRNLMFCLAVSAATVVSQAAFAGDQVNPGGPVKAGNGGIINDLPNAFCASGFTASPNRINAGEKYNQSYTCTGPKIVCSANFSPLGSPVPVSGGIGGATDSGPPVTIKHGVMVYTCAEPPSPPQ